METRTKRKVTKLVKACPLDLNGYLTKVDLNVLPLGSYDVLIGMDCIEVHKDFKDCFNKKFTCTNETRKLTIVVGIPSVVSVGQFSTVQVKKCVIKGCTLYVIHVLKNQEENKSYLDNFFVLWEYKDEFLGLPSKREIDFSIDLTLEIVPI